MAGDGVSWWPDIQAPRVLLPLDLANVVALTGFTITADLFIGSALTHSSTDYEIWTGPAGTGTKLWSAYLDVGLLLKIVPALAVSVGTRYLRIRMNAGAKQSAWSNDRILVVV